MANPLLDATVTCKLYEDLISKCAKQITSIQTGLPVVHEYDPVQVEDADGDININSDTLSKAKFHELSVKIFRCKEVEFLAALRYELERQLTYHKQRVQQLSAVKVIRAGRVHSYFKTDFINDDNARARKYYHFDGDNIAREMEFHSGQQPFLHTAGRDDAKMCQLVLQAAKDIMGLKDDTAVAEDEFNDLWLQNGGLPYVRPTRLARRHLFNALSKRV